MTRMGEASEDKRGSVEDTLSNLGVARVLINAQVLLRIEQAIRRDSQLTDLLSPAIDDIKQIDVAVSGAQSIIGGMWEENNANGWK